MSAGVGQQLPLLFGNYEYRLSSLVRTTHVEAIDAVEKLVENQDRGLVYLWGGSSAGKTHLLQAACAHTAASNRRPAYLPLSRA